MNIAISIISVLPWIRASECAHTPDTKHTPTHTLAVTSPSPPPLPPQSSPSPACSSPASSPSTRPTFSGQPSPMSPMGLIKVGVHARTHARPMYVCTPSVGSDTSTPPLAAQSATSPTVLAGSCPRVATSWQCPSLASSSCSSRSPTSGKSPAPPHPSLGG